MIAALLAAILAASGQLTVILPDGSRISAQRVEYRPSELTVVIVEGAIFRDGFE
ncbi:MAG: hypothetical protein KA329_12795 [Novosphingobium sp.]|nr:hypothetical protein [Novosphingobium sp.]